MSIRNKLYTIGLLIIVLLLVLTSYLFIQSYKKYTQASGLQSILKINSQLSNTLRDIGKERGLTAMYMGDKKQEFLTSLNTQRTHTDTSLNNLTNQLENSDNYEQSIFHKWLGLYPVNTTQYERLLDDIKQINTIRQSVDKNLSPYDTIFKEGYTKILTTPILNNLLQIKNITSNQNMASLTSHLEQLYIAKENTGLERDILTHYLMKQQPIPANNLSLLEIYTAKANLFGINNLNNAEIKKELHELMSTPDAVQIIKKTSTMAKKLKRIRKTNNYLSNGINWFTQETKKITLLSKAELILSNELWKNNESYLSKQMFILTILALIALLGIILAYVGYKAINNLLPSQYSEQTQEIGSHNENENNIFNPEEQITMPTEDNPFMNAFKTITNDVKNRVLNKTHALTGDQKLENDTLLNETSETVTQTEELTLTDNICINKVEENMEENNDFFITPGIKETPIITEEVQSSTPSQYIKENTTSPNKKILIAKKFLLARNVLAQVLDNLGYEYTASAELNTLIDDINSNQYDIVFTDDDYLSENIESDHTRMMIITSPKSKDEIAYLIKKQRS